MSTIIKSSWFHFKHTHHRLLIIFGLRFVLVRHQPSFIAFLYDLCQLWSNHVRYFFLRQNSCLEHEWHLLPNFDFQDTLIRKVPSSGKFKVFELERTLYHILNFLIWITQDSLSLHWGNDVYAIPRYAKNIKIYLKFVSFDDKRLKKLWLTNVHKSIEQTCQESFNDKLNSNF